MTEENNSVAVVEQDDNTLTDTERRRKAAILRAVGLDRVPIEQRELALAIANRYDLDLMLKHLVLIDGRPYITRDALLWVAHRSGVFDGIHVTEPIVKEFPNLGECWYSEASVWRKDMTRSFTYGGRYPVKGGNAKYGPEMAVKVAECMALRRAFNVSAPTVEEQWDTELPATNEPAAPKSLAEKVAERAAQVNTAGGPAIEGTARSVEPTTDPSSVVPPRPPAKPATPPKAPTVQVLPTTPPVVEEELLPPTPDADPVTGEVIEQADDNLVDLLERHQADTTPPPPPPNAMAAPPDEVATTQCPATSPFGGDQCKLMTGHTGVHRSSPKESW